MAAAILAAIFFPLVWIVATFVGLVAAVVAPHVPGRVAPLFKGNATTQVVAVGVAFMVLFLLAGGRLYLYGSGGDLELVVPASYPPIYHNSTQLVVLPFDFYNNGSATVRFNPGGCYYNWFPRLHVIAPNGTEALGWYPPPPPCPPPATPPGDSFVELGPGERLESRTTVWLRWEGRFFVGDFPERGNYTVFWTFDEERVGPSGLPCFVGHIRSANAILPVV